MIENELQEGEDIIIPPQYNIVSQFKNLRIVGDIHGCFSEFLKCVLDNSGLGYRSTSGKLYIKDPSKYVHHILIGDLIDKGLETRRVIRFVAQNLQYFTVIRGNHEQWVYEYFRNGPDFTRKSKRQLTELITDYFDSVLEFAADEQLKSAFFAIFSNSVDFVETEHFIVTHAPCKIEYLGVQDKKAVKHMRNIKYPKEREFDSIAEYRAKKRETLQFLIDEGDIRDKWHIFGHIPTPEIFTNKNKLGIDTGCVYGNKLTALTFWNNQREFEITSYPSQSIEPKTELEYYFE